MSLIDNEPHSATVRAEVQTDMLILGRAEFARCLPEKLEPVLRHHARPGAAPAQADRRSSRWRCWTSTAASRARCSTCRETDGEVKIIRNKVSRQDLAKMVGASREMVSRVMKDLEERGFIETQENGSVIIKERADRRSSVQAGALRARRAWRRGACATIRA